MPLKKIDYLPFLEACWREHLTPKADNAPTVISTFAGAGGSSLGYSMAGFCELLAVEWDDNAVQTFKLNFPDVPVYHGDIAKLSVDQVLEMTGLKPGELDVFDGSPPCFPKGSMVTSSHGKIPIDFCAVGYEVLSHTGKFQKVLKMMTRKFSGTLYAIETKYGRKSITSTPEHPFFARRRIVKTRDNATRKNGTQYKAYSDPEWIDAKNLQVGDVICEPHVAGEHELNIRAVVRKQRVNISGQSGVGGSEMQLVESCCQIDWRANDMAWMLGFYLAEGHTRGHNPTIEDEGACRREVILSIADKESFAIANRISELGLHPQIQKHSQGSSRITITDIDFWALCQVVGKGAGGKFIPNAFHVMPIEWQASFLDGYFSGDGCFVSKQGNVKRKATTISWDIATGIALMVARVFQVVASIEVLYPAGFRKIQNRDVEVQETYSVSYALQNSDRVRPGFVDDYGAWLPIKDITTSEVSDIDVYNMEVENDNSYVVEGYAVHNCQGFSTAGKRQLDDPRNQLFREYIRLLRGLQPKVFVMENVSGMVKGVMKLVFAEILRELKASGYQVKARLLNAMYFNVPQSRERMIFIGVREDLGLDPTHPAGESMPIATKMVIPGLDATRSQRINPGIDALRPCATICKMNEGCQDLVLSDEDLKEAKIKDTWQMSRVLNGKEAKSHFSLVKLNPDNPSPTITKDAGNTSTGLVHPFEIRKLTIPEIKRLASFPDEFQMIGDYKKKWERIGNSVPPLFMRSIARHLRAHILEHTLTRHPAAG